MPGPTVTPSPRRLCSGRYFGRTVARHSACGLLIVETVYPPGDELPWHSHESPYLLVVLDGVLLERAGRRDHECRRGTLVLNRAGEPHRDLIGHDGARCLNIELGASWVDASDDDDDDDVAGNDDAAYRFAGAALDAVGLLEAELCRPDTACALEIESAVHRLIGAAARERNRRVEIRANWMRDVLAVLHDEPGVAPALRHLAAAAGVHPAHLCRTFAARHGCTIGQYVRRLRADRALAQILHTRKPLASLAVDNGFVDQSHLTRAVREFYQTTPARLRRASGRA